MPGSFAAAKRPPKVAGGVDSRIRLSVLGGFLGSGKTTWLRHHARHGVFQDAFVIVNEVAEMPVDDALIPAASMAVLAGGCACCTGKADLIAMIRDICDNHISDVTPDDRPKRIVIETSGLADPFPIVEAIRNDVSISRHIVVSEVLVVVDGLHGLGLLRRDPLARKQIEAADCLIVSKLDEAKGEELGRLLATLQLLNPRAAVFGAIKGVETPLPNSDDAIPEDLADLSMQAERPAIFSSVLTIGENIDWPAFSMWLSALLYARGDDVLRVKGVVRTPAGRILVQAVRNGIQTPEILPEGAQRAGEGADNNVVVVGRGYNGADLMRSLRIFAGIGKE
jgi:G3E family GTPase